MKAIALAHAYVNLDRFVFFQCQRSSALKGVLDRVKHRLRDNEGLMDFDKLCGAGADGNELLWLLAGCEGLPGFATTFEVFGWTTPELKKGIVSIERAVAVIEKMQSYPFGLLAAHADSVSAMDLDKRLRSYLSLTREAWRDFGHSTEWFLNLTKARLVIHITHWTHTGPHDNEVSGLIAAMTGTDYNADAQRRWRRRHSDLVQDRVLDPQAIQNPAEREQVRKSWEQIAFEAPDFFEGLTRFTDDYAALARFRRNGRPNRKSAKNMP